ncbi:MAG: DUF1549 and DUF1553 domain-containing protein [Fuerstiella sp.]|nr:DUF1549 and DUF1553 domain-containing protein [Fuerstiella sp.]
MATDSLFRSFMMTTILLARRRSALRPSLAILLWMWITGGAVGAPSEFGIDEPLLIDRVQTTTSVALVGPSSSHQLLLTATRPDGRQLDVTRSVVYSVTPSNVVAVDKSGFVKPLGNGTATIAARLKRDDSLIEISAEVTSFHVQRPVSFPNDVVPQLTRAGCNGGACHGTPKGRNNFRLSLLGFEPREDYEFLTRESRGRRFFPAAPERSLLLQKACGEIPHGGGVRLPKKSDSYELLKRWIAEGLSYGPENDPTVERIEIHPSDRVVSRGGSQQLAVMAFFSDGTSRDVTRVVEYKANQPDMCSVDHHGLATFEDMTGTTSVMIRFQEHVGAFMATIPLGLPMPDLPVPANFIDELIFAKLKTLGLPPSAACDDSTFLRRVSLDIAGRLPTVRETKEFLASRQSGKRAAAVHRLLDDVGYADLFANKWAGILRNKAGGNLEQVARETFGFHAWIRASLSVNKPFDQFATELITARGRPDTNPAVSWYRAVSDPKDQMADIAQVFLGVRIQCAQCHHHPYEKWTQDDYHGFAAFFSTIGRKEVRKLPEDDILFHKRILAVAKNPNTNVDQKPTPLGGEPLEIPAERDPRIDLAKAMVSPANPYFAKILVNRYWKHFLGRGLVEPEDDMRVTNPATHPRLLDQLAKSFSESGYDLKALCRAICNSQTYQRSSFPNDHNSNDEQNFARYYPRRLAAEVMLDAMNEVAGARNNFNHQPVGVRAVALPDDSANNDSFFLRVFGRPQMDTACECERSASADLSQSLHLINSDAMHRILSASDGRAVKSSRDKDADNQTKVTELYQLALSRDPTDSEVSVALAHLQKKQERSAEDPKVLSSDQAAREGWEDIIWVVVNTKEFLFNH